MNIRDVTDKDVERIRDLFVKVYGTKYPFTGFYDTEWLKKSVYDDGTLFLLMEEKDEIVATASMMLTSGDMDDLIGETGRLVALPDDRFRGKGLFVDLISELERRAASRVQFIMGEARTVHRGSQRIVEQLGWTPIGFEPMKYLLDRRESPVMYAKPVGMALELRRNNPRLIPEALVLAQTALAGFGFPADVVVDDEDEGYPTGRPFRIDHLQNQQGMAALLRIARGRVTRREIFGNFSLSHGYFRIASRDADYLVVRDGDAVLGAVGFCHDPIDRKVRIFELIESDDAVKGALLAAVDRVAAEELRVDYVEVDISAYAPKMQRTLDRLGFVPIAYAPSMVFEHVERLDVLRMAKVLCPYDPGPLSLVDGAARMRDIVERGFDHRRRGMQITAATRDVDLFRGIPDGELYHLARIATIEHHPAGTVLVREGDPPDKLYILVRGCADVTDRTGRKLGALGPGRIFGEMALVEKSRRSADVRLTEASEVIAIGTAELERLLEAYPRLGYAVARNLARGLSDKLRAVR